MSSPARLNESWTLGSLRVPNRVLLAPLAGIGNWFVRLQAKRYGAGMAVSEMVSSHAIHYRNPKTCGEMLRIDPRERAGGPVAIQLFGEDPAMMRSAAAHVVAAGADVIDINMGCPVPKVRKTGAGAALLENPDLAVAVARAAVEGGAGVSEARRGSGHREAALRAAPRRGQRLSARPPPRRRGRRRRDRLSPALGRRAPQRHARLRAGRAAGALAPRSRDPHGRHGRRRGRARGVRRAPAPPP